MVSSNDTPVGAQIGEHVVDAIAALWIDADCRLVEQHDARAVHDAAGDIEAAAHAAGELLDRLGRSIREPGALEHPVDLLRELPARKPLQAAERLEVLARAQERIERDFLGHDTQFVRRLPAGEHPVEQPDLAAIQPDAAGDPANQRRLASAVWSKERQQLPFAKLERRTVECLYAAKRLRGVRDRQDGHVSSRKFVAATVFRRYACR